MCAAPLNTRYRREERSSTQTTQTNVLVAHIGVLGHCTTWLGESVALAAINDGLGPLRRRPVLCTEEISFAEHPKSHKESGQGLARGLSCLVYQQCLYWRTANGQRFSALPNLIQNARRRRPISLTRLTAAPEDLDPPGQPA